jgi:hypothetical protein
MMNLGQETYNYPYNYHNQYMYVPSWNNNGDEAARADQRQRMEHNMQVNRDRGLDPWYYMKSGDGIQGILLQLLHNQIFQK